jgi:hypothetical protein
LERRGGSIGGEVSDHFVYGGDDSFLPASFAELFSEWFASPCEVDAAGTIDECTEAIFSEGAGGICRGTALGAVTWDEEGDGGDLLAKFSELGGPCGADHGADASPAIIGRSGRFVELTDNLGCGFVEGRIFGDAILQLCSAGVAGADEHVQSGTAAGGNINEGLE